MKKLEKKFDEDRLRRIYEIQGHEGQKLPKETIDRIIIRSKLLMHNPIFVEGWNDLEDIQRKIRPDVKSVDKFNEAKKKFSDKWYVNFPDGLHRIAILPSLYVLESWDNVRFGTLKVDIDLEGSPGKIMQEIKALVSYRKQEYFEVKEMNLSLNKTLKDEKMKKRVEGYVSVNLKDLDKMLEIYAYTENIELDNRGRRRWQQVVDHCNVKENSHNSYTANQIAEKSYNTAKELIEKGLSGFPPFPQR